jgi:hypothetical protein
VTRLVTYALVLSVFAACGASTPPLHVGARVERDEVMRFAYRTLDGGELSSRTTRGRALVLVFVTTYDLASQVEAKRLALLHKVRRPPFRAGAVVLEGTESTVLAEAFQSALGLEFPVAMADRSTLEGLGPFGPFSQIPTTVVLDATGREVWRKQGLTEDEELERALSRAQTGE